MARPYPRRAAPVFLQMRNLGLALDRVVLGDDAQGGGVAGVERRILRPNAVRVGELGGVVDDRLAPRVEAQAVILLVLGRERPGFTVSKSFWSSCLLDRAAVNSREGPYGTITIWPGNVRIRQQC